VNFGERGKSSGRHSLTSTVTPVLSVSLTKGPLRVCVGLVKGFIRVHWRGFRGDDPGSPRFDRCLTGLTRQIRSLALMTVIKNLGRHSLVAVQVLLKTSPSSTRGCSRTIEEASRLLELLLSTTTCSGACRAYTTGTCKEGRRRTPTRIPL
jgi:hypothetical protein